MFLGTLGKSIIGNMSTRKGSLQQEEDIIIWIIWIKILSATPSFKQYQDY